MLKLRQKEEKQMEMKFLPLNESHDEAIANIIRTNLRNYHLDIPGTAYYDETLDHLSRYYAKDGRAYYVLVKDDTVIGGIGIAEFQRDCCELQKLYLADHAKGNGIGYQMIDFIEAEARRLGYKRIYLETHSNLAPAVHIYERSGYRKIERPESVVHSTMNLFFLKDL